MVCISKKKVELPKISVTSVSRTTCLPSRGVAQAFFSQKGPIPWMRDRARMAGITIASSPEGQTGQKGQGIVVAINALIKSMAPFDNRRLRPLNGAVVRNILRPRRCCWKSFWRDICNTWWQSNWITTSSATKVTHSYLPTFYSFNHKEQIYDC